MKKIRVELFYRDGDNYKFNPVFETVVTPVKFTELQGKVQESDDDENKQVLYDKDLGISRAEFHESIGYKYRSSSDHNFVSITSLEEIN